MYIILAKGKGKTQTTNHKKKEAIKPQISNSELSDTINQDVTLTESENALSKSELDGAKEPEENYSIYEYLKNNTSVLIAVVSASVAIIAAVLRIGSYLYHSQYLKYWNIDPQLYSAPETYWVESVTLSFILQICCGLFYIISYKTNKVFISRKQIIKKANSYIKEEKKEIRKLKKDCKNCKQKMIAKDIQNTISKCESQIGILKSQKKEINRLILKEYIINVPLIFFLLVVICIILVRETDSFFKNLVLAFGLMAIMFLVTYFIAKVNNKKVQDKHIKKKYFEEDYPLSTLILSKTKQVFSNSDIKGFIWFMFVFAITFSFSEIFSGYFKAKNNKEFPIILIDNKEYAVVYSDESDLFAEKIEINGKNATIYINEQIVIPKENVKMKEYSFEGISKENS